MTKRSSAADVISSAFEHATRQLFQAFRFAIWALHTTISSLSGETPSPTSRSSFKRKPIMSN